MEIMTISEVSRNFNVSTRMLHYYEKVGLISSSRKEDYAYRVYDETAVRRLQQTIILRKLRIPIKLIGVILNDYEQIKALQIMREKIIELDDEINALNTIRNILNVFVNRLDESIEEKIHLDLLEDSELIEVVNALSLSKFNLKEEQSMEELNNANKIIGSQMEIRIVYLPPATVAASQYVGENPEDNAGEKLRDFIKSVNLPEIKPDFRVYGFNNPSPQEGQEHYGYEFWVTIPDDMKVSESLEKRKFAGGLYAAHCIKMGDFHEWRTFYDHMKKSDEYDIDCREPYGMGGTLEEHINAYSYYTGAVNEYVQLDLLIPIKKKN